MISREEFTSRFPGVSLIAVSKLQPFSAIEALYRRGHRDFGENYVQELLAKDAEAIARGLTEIRWHLIGPLQSNKAAKVAPRLFAFHALDSLSLGEKLAKARAGLPPLRAFIQVNLDGEESKSGVEPHEAMPLSRSLSEVSGLQLEGLMALPKPNRPESELKASFMRLVDLEISCRPNTRGGLSMGTSEDYEIAISAGATHVRLGRVLFGDRPITS